MTIGEFARACQVSERMLRFYEEAGILQPQRSEGGYRLYEAEDVAYVQKIALLNQAGLPLKEIAQLRDCLREQPQDFCSGLRARLQAVSDDIDRKVADLRASQALLADLLAR